MLLLNILDDYNNVSGDTTSIMVLTSNKINKGIMLLDALTGVEKWRKPFNSFPILSGIEISVWENGNTKHVMLKGDQDLYTINIESGDIVSEKRFKNRFNIYIDNSKSIAYSNIKADSLLSIISYFDQWSIDNELESKKFIFGDSVRLFSNKKVDFSDNSTNFFDLKSTIEKEQNATNLIISDGNSTQGYNLSNLKFDFPINFIGVGFINFEDISISNIFVSSFFERCRKGSELNTDFKG